MVNAAIRRAPTTTPIQRQLIRKRLIDHLTQRMSYRRRKISDAGLDNLLSKTERPAAVSSIRLVRPFFSWVHISKKSKSLPR
jgi:hypothetical protein